MRIRSFRILSKLVSSRRSSLRIVLFVSKD